MSSSAGAQNASWVSSLPGETTRIAIAPSGEYAAISDSGGTLTVLDVGTGEVVHMLDQNHGGWNGISIAFSRDSELLAVWVQRFNPSGPNENQVKIFDTHDWQEHSHHQGGADDLAFSHDGSFIVASERFFGEEFSDAYCFKTFDGNELWRKHVSGGPQGSARLSALSRDSKFAVFTPTAAAPIVVLDTATGNPRLPAISIPERAVSAICSPDDRWIVVAGGDGLVRVFDATNGAPAWSAKVVDNSFVESLDISADSRWCAAVSGQFRPVGGAQPAGFLNVFDLTQNGRPRYSAPVPLGASGRVRYSPTLDRILVNATYGPPASDFPPPGFAIINSRNGEAIVSATLPEGNPFAGDRFAVTPDGVALIVGHGQQHAVARYETKALISRCDVRAAGSPDTLSITAVGTSPAGPVIAAADSGGTVTVIHAQTGARLHTNSLPGPAVAVAFARGGAAVAFATATAVRLFDVLGAEKWTINTSGVNGLVAAGTSGDSVAVAAGKTVQMLNSADGSARWQAPNTHPLTVTRVAASDDGKWLATACADRATRIINTTTGQTTLSRDAGIRIAALAFQPHGSLVASADDNGKAIIIDANANAERTPPPQQPFACTRVAFSFDGDLLAVAYASDDHQVIIYDITGTGIPQPTRKFSSPGPVTDLAFNPKDNTLVICADQSAVVRDIGSGIELTRIAAPVSRFAIGADGLHIATIANDSVVRTWASGMPSSGS